MITQGFGVGSPVVQGFGGYGGIVTEADLDLVYQANLLLYLEDTVNEVATILRTIPDRNAIQTILTASQDSMYDLDTRLRTLETQTQSLEQDKLLNIPSMSTPQPFWTTSPTLLTLPPLTTVLSISALEEKVNLAIKKLKDKVKKSTLQKIVTSKEDEIQELETRIATLETLATKLSSRK